MPSVTINVGVGTCFCISLHCLVLGIVNMIYAEGHNDVECNVPHHSMGLDLGDFLFWFAVAMFVQVGVFAVMCFSLCCMAADRASVAICTGIVCCVVMALTCMFMLAWSVVGAIILFQDAIGCIESQDSIGILSLVNLIVFWSSSSWYIFVISRSVTVEE